MSDKEPQEKKKEPLPPVFTFINAGLSGYVSIIPNIQFLFIDILSNFLRHKLRSYIYDTWKKYE